MTDDGPKPGEKVRVRGSVSHFHPGGAVVDFPTASGGAIGVPTTLQKIKAGDVVTLEAEVIETGRGTLRLKFPGGQVSDIATLRVTE